MNYFWSEKLLEPIALMSSYYPEPHPINHYETNSFKIHFNIFLVFTPRPSLKPLSYISTFSILAMLILMKKCNIR